MLPSDHGPTGVAFLDESGSISQDRVFAVGCLKLAEPSILLRQAADPVARFGSPWRAYQKLAEQLIVGSIKPRELLTVLADNYSTPDSVRFEQDLCMDLNQRLGRLAILTVCWLDSNATDALQIVDLLTSAVAFEFRQSAGTAAASNAKAELAEHVRRKYGVQTFLKGCRPPPLNVAIYGSRSAAV